MRYAASFCNQSDRGAIEAGEDLAAEPSAFEGDDTVGEVAAGGQHSKASLDGRPVHAHRGAFEQASDHTDHLAGSATVSSHQHPGEFAQRRHRHCYDLRIAQHLRRPLCLFRVIQYRGAHENIRVDRDPQRRPAQPSAAISAISSIVSGLVPGRYPQPMKLSIDPPDLAARTSRRPFGSRSISTFWPGVTPRCLNTSLRSVTCPFAVTVRVVPMDA